MATGTSGGLLEDSDRHAQSVFKHEILRQYMQPFVSMVGSASKGRRLVVLDGFAGRGRYPDGKPGSAELILQAIESLGESRLVSAFFVEKEERNYEVLSAVVDEYVARGVLAKTLPDDVDSHLDTVVTAADGVPLFLFLDPCGASLPFDRFAGVLAGPRRPEHPRTELLLNFSAGLSRRAAGALNAGRFDDPIIPCMDVTCGGEWWRDSALDALRRSPTGNFEPVAAAVAEEYARRLAHAGAMMHVTVPVRRRLNRQPVYHLVFMTRSPYGLWVFANALAKARQAWLRALGSVQDDDDAVLFTIADNMEWLMESERNTAIAMVTANLRNLARRLVAFRLVEHTADVYGEAYGVATESVVTKAVQDLKSRGELIILQNASKLRDRVVGRPKR